MNVPNFDAYERFKKLVSRPVVWIEGNDLVFSDGSDDGHRYPLAKIDAFHPLWDLFSKSSWLTEQHLSEAAHLVRWEFDRRAKDEAREADRGRGLS